MDPQNQVMRMRRRSARRSVVDNYHSGQSTVIGIMLIIAGALSVISNTVNLAIGLNDNWTHYFLEEIVYGHFEENGKPLFQESFDEAGHGFWSGVPVSTPVYYRPIYTMLHKKEPHIFDYNCRISWSIFIILPPLETGMNTPQSRVIYLLT